VTKHRFSPDVLDQMEGQAMSRRQREVFRLVYREQIGIIPAAVELDVSRGTVNNELRKIRERFMG
jgi:DNA-directed RNA polymerase specialized sigma24 family protein